MHLAENTAQASFLEAMNPVGTFECYRSDFINNPSNRSVLSNLEKVTEQLDAWSDLYITTLNVAPQALGKSAQVFLHLKMGDWCLYKMSSPGHALAHYQQAMEIAPEDYTVYKRLTDLYEANEQWHEGIYALGLALERCPLDAETRKTIYYQLGQNYEVLVEDWTAARYCYEKGLEIAPTDLTLLDSADRCYLAMGKWWQLLTVLMQKIPVLREPLECFNNYKRIAQLRKTEFSDIEGAIEAYETALDIVPDDVGTLKELQIIYESLGRNLDLRNVLERLFRANTCPKEKLQLAERLGNMLEDLPKEREKAAAYFETVIELAPSHQRAYESLQKIYRRQKEWNKLVVLLEHKCLHSEDPKEWIPLYLEKGRLYLYKCLDFDGAVESFKDALTLAPENTEAIALVALTYEKNQQWGEATVYYERLIKLTEDPLARAKYYHRLGRIAFGQINDPEKAIDYLLKAIALDRNLRPALADLSEIYLSQEDWQSAISTLKAELLLANKRSEKSRLAATVGDLYLKSGNREDAYSWYENAISLNQYDIHSLESLTKMYLTDGLYPQADTLLEQRLRFAKNMPDDEKQALFLTISRVAYHLENRVKNLDFAKQAKAIGRPNGEVTLNLAHALFREALFDDALAEYKAAMLLQNDLGSQKVFEEIVFPMAEIHMHKKNYRKAIRPLKRIVEFDPNSLRAWELLTEAYSKTGKVSESVNCQWQKAHLIKEPERRFDAFLKLGNRLRTELDDNEEALRAFALAREIFPLDLTVLRALFDVHCDNEDWSSAEKIALNLAKQETTSLRRSQINYQLGLIYRDNLLETDKALECFHRALDEEPTALVIFRSSIKLLAKTKQWSKLILSYRAMQKRAQKAGQTELEVALLTGLGNLYMRKIKSFDLAAEVYKEALEIDPKSVVPRRKLALCYSLIPEKKEQAVSELKKLIQLYPENAEYLRLLGDIYISQKRTTETRFVCGLLVSLGQAGETAKSFYEIHQPRSIPRLSRPLTGAEWDKYIRHPDDCSLLGAVFDVIQEALQRRYNLSPKFYGARRRDRLGKNDKSSLFATLFHRTCTDLGFDRRPLLYKIPNDFSPLQFTRLNPPTSIFGESYLMNSSQKEMLFRIAQHLSYYRPGRMIQFLIPQKAALKLTLLSACRNVAPKFPLSDRVAKALAPSIKSLDSLLDDEQQSRLKTAVNNLLEAGVSLKISKYLKGISHTACRTGFFLIGDIQKTTQYLDNDTVLLGSAAEPCELFDDLKLFCLSDEYRHLREGLL